MSQILDILKEFLKEVEKENPFNLVLKGGTALSLYYLNHHRESEDLDFDTEKHFTEDHKNIKNYLENILKVLKEKKIIIDYKITKAEFASTQRYHIKIELKTHKTFYTKIDLDFVDLPNNLIKNGKLNLYSIERLFISKLVTFVSRKEFKDFYDVAFLSKKMSPDNFKKKEPVVRLLQDVIQTVQKEDVEKMFKLAFKNVDLKFKNLKDQNVEKFINESVNNLRTLINKLRKY